MLGRMPSAVRASRFNISTCSWKIVTWRCFDSWSVRHRNGKIIISFSCNRGTTVVEAFFLNWSKCLRTLLPSLRSTVNEEGPVLEYITSVSSGCASKPVRESTKILNNYAKLISSIRKWEQLSDNHINAANQLLQGKLSEIQGLASPVWG